VIHPSGERIEEVRMMTGFETLLPLLALVSAGGGDPGTFAPPPPDSVLAACQTVQRTARRVLMLETRLEADVEVTNEFVHVSPQRRGCRVAGHTDEDRVAAPVDDLAEALVAEGWERLLAYQADGPDGSLTGLSVGPVLCVISGRWDGGDDSDTTYVPVPGYDLDVQCFRRTQADERPF
jgi:hypothetical protein